MKLFIVVPAYNEEEFLGLVLRDIFSLYPQTQTVVVDDGSTDATARTAAQAGAVVLRHLVNRGQGAALKTGTDYALEQGAEIVVHFDADGQFAASEIEELIKPILAAETEVVLGSRFLKSNRIPWTKRFLLLPLGRFVNRLFSGLRLSDAHNGFRALSRRAAALIEIGQDRMAHNSEIIFQIRKHRLSFREIPVTVYYRRYGQGLGGGIRIMRDLIFQKLFD